MLLRENSKAAAFKRWQEVAMSPQEGAFHLRRGRFNVGLRLDQGVLVFDKDESHRETYNWLRRHRIRSPMEVETRNGIHVFQRLTRRIEDVRSRIRFLGLKL